MASRSAPALANTAALPMSQITRLRRTRSRFSRSPTRNPISTTGVNSANSSADTQPGEPVMSNIRMARAIAAIQVPSTLMAVASQNRRNSPPPGPTSARMSDLEVGELTGAASYRPPRRGALSDFGRAAVTAGASQQARARPPCRIRIPREWSSRFGSTMRQRAVSSVGRAPARQAGGHWFEPSTAHPPDPAQPSGIRAVPLHAGNRQRCRVATSWPLRALGLPDGLGAARMTLLCDLGPSRGLRRGSAISPIRRSSTGVKLGSWPQRPTVVRDQKGGTHMTSLPVRDQANDICSPR